jgi:hypothetical protein
MKRFVLMIMLMMASMGAYAGSSSQGTVTEETQGIITPELATGMWRTNRFIYDKNLNILICPKDMDYEINMTIDNTCENKQKKMAWVTMENTIPQGAKYVGFKSITANGSHYIEIYWKKIKQ